MFLFFLTTIIGGYLLLKIFLDKSKLNFFVLLAFSYGIGSFFVTIQLFLVLFIFKLSFSYVIFLLILIIEYFILFLVGYKKKVYITIKPSAVKFSFFELLLVLLIIFQIIFSLAHSISRPVVAYDSVAMWSLKSKILFYEKKINFDENNNFLYMGGGGHINYPWHVPLLEYWMHENLHEFNDVKVNIIFFSYYLSIILVFFYFLSRYIKRNVLLVFTLFLSSTPLLFYHSFNAYADLTLSFYLLCVIGFLYLFFIEKQKRYLYLSGLFCGISFFVKDTAIIFIIAVYLSMFIYLLLKRISLKSVLSFSLCGIVPVLPWILFKYSHNLSISNVESRIGFHPEIFKSFYESFFITNNWNVLWFIFILSIIYKIKKILIKENLFGVVFIFLSLLGLVILYLFTERYLYAVDYTAIHRNILILIPSLFLILGFLFKNNYSEAK